MSPDALAQVLRPLQDMFLPQDHPDLLVGLGSPDDAAVYRLDNERALILTTDFFTPVVDDPYDYGAIAAANALSDIYAMGGKPFIALNLAAFPARLPPEILTHVMIGMAETVRSSGAVIAGGHTIMDEEPKIGLCVAGFAHPDRLLAKSGVQAGDQLVLTKPLGSGIITTAAKIDRVNPDDLTEAVKWMKHLNRAAGEIAVDLRLRGGTDITGFGLLGHAWEMAEASQVTLRISSDSIPWMSGARQYACEGFFPGGSASNYSAFHDQIIYDGWFDEDLKMLLFDSQTSGGLLLAVPPEKIGDFQKMMERRRENFWVIGVAEGNRAGIRVD